MSSPTTDACGNTNWPECGRAPPPETSTKAQTSLKLGLLSLVLTVLTGPLAILWGFLALRDIRSSPGPVRGRGIALAGIGTGVAGTLLGAWLLILACEVVEDASDRSS
jgi:hypothetical protein